MIIRKLIAALKLNLNDQNRSETIKKINILKQSEITEQNLTLGHLIKTLEQMLIEESAKFKNRLPSQTDIERWALKSAVLDYYKSLGIPSETKIIEDPTRPRTVHKFAPNKNVIYDLWLRKLADLAKRDDANKFNPQQYDLNANRGIPRGGAFEKMLLRFREEFVKRMLQ